MQTLPIAAVKSQLNELVEAANVTREQITITKNGSPAAVLIGADEWESLQETLSRLSRPGARDRVARAETASGGGLSEEQIPARFRQPSRGGRKSKGDRRLLGTRPPAPLAAAARKKADKLGMTVNDYLITLLARDLNFPDFAPKPADAARVLL